MIKYSFKRKIQCLYVGLGSWFKVSEFDEKIVLWDFYPTIDFKRLENKEMRNVIVEINGYCRLLCFACTAWFYYAKVCASIVLANMSFFVSHGPWSMNWWNHNDSKVFLNRKSNEGYEVINVSFTYYHTSELIAFVTICK